MLEASERALEKSGVNESDLVVLPLVGSPESSLHGRLRWHAASRGSVDLQGKDRSSQRAFCLEWVLANTPGCLEQESVLARTAPAPPVLGGNRRDCCRERYLVHPTLISKLPATWACYTQSE